MSVVADEADGGPSGQSDAVPAASGSTDASADDRAEKTPAEDEKPILEDKGPAAEGNDSTKEESGGKGGDESEANNNPSCPLDDLINETLDDMASSSAPEQTQRPEEEGKSRSDTASHADLLRRMLNEMQGPGGLEAPADTNGEAGKNRIQALLKELDVDPENGEEGAGDPPTREEMENFAQFLETIGLCAKRDGKPAIDPDVLMKVTSGDLSEEVLQKLMEGMGFRDNSDDVGEEASASTDGPSRTPLTVDGLEAQLMQEMQSGGLSDEVLNKLVAEAAKEGGEGTEGTCSVM